MTDEIQIPPGFIECFHDENQNSSETGERVWHSPKFHEKPTPQVPESLVAKMNRDQLVAELRRCAVQPSEWGPLLGRAADYIESIEHLQNEIERMRTAIVKAKIGLVPSLKHGYKTCNEGVPPFCFVCEGLDAVEPFIDYSLSDVLKSVK